jgi:hypothetical protein
VGKIASSFLWKGWQFVKREMNQQLSTVADPPRLPPVRVRLRRINASHAKPYPPDGLSREWWTRLKGALGTGSSDVVQATLLQLVEAARLPGGGISETAVNAAIAFVEDNKPNNEIEGALLVQMGCTHQAIMAVLGCVAGAHGPSRNLAMMAAAAAKLISAYAKQVETFRRLRNGGSQYVRIEHVHVEGGQAIVGAVNSQTR